MAGPQVREPGPVQRGSHHVNPEPALLESGDCKAGAVNRDALAGDQVGPGARDVEVPPAIGGPGLLHSPDLGDDAGEHQRRSSDQERVVTERAALDHGPPLHAGDRLAGYVREGGDAPFPEP